MDELGWFSCPSAFGATPRPAPAYPCTHSLIFGAYGSHCAALKKEDTFWGHHMAGRPPWSVEHGAASLYKRWCTGVMGTLLFLVALVPRQVLPSFALFAIVSLHVHKKKKKKYFLPLHLHLHFVFTFFTTQECVCGGTTTPQEWFSGASLPIRMILWSVITHKNDFCESQSCPTRTTNSRTANFDFH